MTKISKEYIDRRSAFKKANKARKRVMIARDVLAQLLKGSYDPTEGVWVIPENLNYKSTDELCDVLSGKCEVCGLGSLFVSAVRFADKFKVNELSEFKEGEMGSFSDGDVFDYLGDFFTNKQLQQIESAFEQGLGHCDNYEGSCFFDNLVEPHPAVRMRLIMENIIVHNGTFNPKSKPTERKVYTTPGFKG